MNSCRKICLILILFSASPVWGKATLGIWPVRVNLTPDQKIAEVILRNRGENEVKTQVYAKTWDMDEHGEFIETDTGDFVFFPRLLTIPGGEEKTLRVGYNGDFPRVEKSYRLYIQELPEIQTPKQKETKKMEASFDFLLKLSVPVFVMPSNAPEPVKAEIAGVEPAETGLKVSFRNAGIRNFLLKKIEARLMDKNGTVIDEFKDDYIQRVLPMRSVFLRIPLKSSQCGKAAKLFLRLFLDDSDKPLSQTLDLNPDCTFSGSSVPMSAE
ncbi:MAG: fimbria/pilus periplasmic chaperone [Desulfobacterales bacterium]